MMTFFGICLLAAALWADAALYRLRIRSCRWPDALKRALLAAAALPDLAVVSTYALYPFIEEKSVFQMHFLMWCTFFFLVFLAIKLFVVAGSLLDRRRGTRIFRPAGWAAGIACAAVMASGATQGRSAIRVERVEICSARIPQAFDGFRIVQLSDLHIGSLINAERFVGQLVDTVRMLGPDMVVSTGDLVNIRYTELTPRFMELLSGIRAPHGVYSVLGNHDLGFYVKDTLAMPPEENVERLVALQREMGWRVLADSSEYVRRGDDSILVTGLGFPVQAHLNGHNSSLAGTDLDAVCSRLDSSSYHIVLSHAPQLWGELCDRGCGDLTLSGHVHAMQMKFRIFGHSISPARAVYRQWSGRYESGGRVLYVNDGLGCVLYPMRIGARPEVTLIELRRCE